MVIGPNGHIQMDEPLLVQLLQQLPVQVCNLAGSWLAAILASLQLLWAQRPELLLTCCPGGSIRSLVTGVQRVVSPSTENSWVSYHSNMIAVPTPVGFCCWW